MVNETNAAWMHKSISLAKKNIVYGRQSKVRPFAKAFDFVFSYIVTIASRQKWVITFRFLI